MPIRNMGTLLENIVIVEAFRLLAQCNHENKSVHFLNSFAMPPLADWAPHRTDYGFSEAQLSALSAGPQPNPACGYPGLLWSCLQQAEGGAVTLGPNGALLCGALAQLMDCPLSLWLNDVPNGHYGNALPGLGEINETIRQVLDLSVAPINPVVVCGSAWPACLAQPQGEGVPDTLKAWGNTAHARLAFLDPMRYRINEGQGGETDSASHREWLRLLSVGTTCPVISVHFTGHNNWNILRPELESMHVDGLVNGYYHTLVASHSYYHVVCNIRAQECSAATRILAENLGRRVEEAWDAWFGAIDREPDSLRMDVR